MGQIMIQWLKNKRKIKEEKQDKVYLFTFLLIERHQDKGSFSPFTVKAKCTLSTLLPQITQPTHPNIRPEKQTQLHSNTTECCDSQQIKLFAFLQGKTNNHNVFFLRLGMNNPIPHKYQIMFGMNRIHNYRDRLGLCFLTLWTRPDSVTDFILMSFQTYITFYL